MPSLGGWEWVILALIALLLFGGSRLAGIGKNAGRAVREFKEETTSLRSAASPSEPMTPPASPPPATQAPSPTDPEPRSERS